MSDNLRRPHGAQQRKNPQTARNTMNRRLACNLGLHWNTNDGSKRIRIENEAFEESGDESEIIELLQEEEDQANHQANQDVQTTDDIHDVQEEECENPNNQKMQQYQDMHNFNDRRINRLEKKISDNRGQMIRV
jgi:hypothetical protein